MICKLRPIRYLGKIGDYKSQYKFLDAQSSKLLYHTEFSSTFGKTYVGLPSEEQMLQDAIKLGLHKFKVDCLDQIESKENK